MLRKTEAQNAFVSTVGSFQPSEYATRVSVKHLTAFLHQIMWAQLQILVSLDEKSCKYLLGFPGGSGGKNPPAMQSHERHGCNPWVRKIPWRRARQLTLVFSPEKSHGQRSLLGYSPQRPKELDITEVT